MIPWTELARGITPAGDELVLRCREGIFEIRFNGWDLMSNRAHRSEEAMAHLACEALESPAPRVLIGGLGMGFTLRAALDALPGSAQVTVAELVPEIIAWNRGPLAPLAGKPLDDPRVRIRSGDIAELLQDTGCRFDAIILDIDNGPDALTYRRNALLYAAEGLALIRCALVPGGRLTIWSADPSPSFEAVLRSGGFLWRRVEVSARGTEEGPWHTIYLAHVI
jgi:spermidine synthase